jgi:hypothetical protein
MVRPLYRYEENSDSPFSFGSIDTAESYYQPFGEFGRLPIPIPFSRSVAYAAGINALYYVNTPRFEVREYALDGSLRAIARARHEPQRIEREHVDAAYQLLHERSSQEFIRTAVAQAFRNFSLSGTMPALGRWAWERVRMQRPDYSTIQVDEVGNIWVVEYAAPGVGRRSWAVFEPEGRLLGSVLFPALFEPFHIGDDFVLGWTLDELDVVTVEMYALRKPHSGPSPREP